MGKRRPTPPRRWLPLARAERVPLTEKQRAFCISHGLDPDEPVEMWANDRYVVIVERSNIGTVEHLSIRRSDRKAARDWRDFQRIKNELAGPEAEAVELFPAESRLVDGANQYHLWCAPPGERVPIGWHGSRSVSNNDTLPDVGGRQRPIDSKTP